MSPLERTDDGVRLRLRIQPRASRTEVVGLHGNSVRIRLSAPPVDGAANEELIRFLAERLGVPRRAVEITAGHSGRQKTVHVEGVAVRAAAEALGIAAA
jgi:uncharacterized protein (TIGR00251 family)